MVLDVEDAQVGVHVRWLLDHLDQYVGRQADWVTLLAYRENDQVFIFRGSQPGKIVTSKGTGGFGFDPFFMPEGADATLAESKPDIYNARRKAVGALINGNCWKIEPVMTDWKGDWQSS
jgi:XTP/dITP diphosphohydrolase